MQRALRKVLAERPDIKPVSASPSNSMSLTGWMMPRGAIAVTNPFSGNVTYNRDMMQGQDPEQVLMHELTHSKQAQTTPWYKTALSLFAPDEKVPAGIPAGSPMNDPYQWRPREMEAYQAERDRAGKMNIPYYTDPVTGSRDLQLPSQTKQRGINTGPSFMGK
jgi:hypothetical protein